MSSLPLDPIEPDPSSQPLTDPNESQFVQAEESLEDYEDDYEDDEDEDDE